MPEEDPPPVQMPLGDSRVETVDLEAEVQRSYLDYAMSVIVGRALPDVRDGLKPVHRRILWGMLQLGARPGTPHKKSARVTGDVMGKFHPHGNQAIYDALARLAQDFTMRHPLIDGKGNFGSVDGDPPAAERYCVTGDTLIRTAEGTVAIADLADAAPNSDTDLDIKVLDHRGDPVLASKLFHSGDHHTYRVATKDGFEITGTSNHPLLCLELVDGRPAHVWRLIGDITPGARVVMSRSHDDFAGQADGIEERHGFLAGAFVSEGFCSPKRAGFNNTDKGFFEAVLAAYDQCVGGRRYVYDRTLPSGKTIYELDVQDLSSFMATPLRELAGLKSSSKTVPSFVWRASTDTKRAFLQALFEGDGSVCLGDRHTLRVYYSTRSLELARQLQVLLLEFGVVSRRRTDRATGEHRLSINNRRDVKLFCDRVGFYSSKQVLLEEYLVTVPESSTAMSKDHIPFLSDYIRANAGRGGLEWLKKHNIDRHERWERDGELIMSKIADPTVREVVGTLTSPAWYYAEVASVEPAGVQPVYSIKVETDEHAFIGNGFVNHNTECRLDPLAMELLRDIDEDTVDMTRNYSDEYDEPAVLPARFPNLLVNGSTGIAVGMATNIPPHNLGEVIDGVTAVIDNPEISTEDLMKIIKGPDFPMGGEILGSVGIRDAYETGRGIVRVRGKCEVEETKRGHRIVITELPYLVSGDRLLEKVKELVDSKKIVGVSGGRNETNRKGTRIVIELKRDAVPQVVLNNLFKYTQLQDSFGMNMLALVDGVPRTLPLRDFLIHYISHQVEVITRRTRFRLAKAEARMHILEGLLVALDNLDAVIKLIRESESADAARTQLMTRYKLSEIQANAILDMQLRKLAALERQKIKDEADEVAATIVELKSILSSPAKVRKIIRDELGEVRKRFANERRTTLAIDEGEFNIEDLIPDEDVVITITRSGYIKRVRSDIYKTQGRGGKGIIGAKPKEGDIVEHMLTTTNHAYVMIFSNRGKVYRIKAHEISEKDRTARGTSIRNILPFIEDERVAAVIDTRDFETHKYLVICTKKGIIKKTEFTAYNSSRRDGIIAVNLRDGDEVVMVRSTSGTDELIMVSRGAMSIRFTETDVRPMGRTASGVIGMRLSGDDDVVSFDVVDPNGELLIITDAGYGKRTLLERYPTQRRGGKGVKTAKLTGKRGSVKGAGVVRVGTEVFLIASDGQVIRMTVKDISRQGRDTTGVRVMRMDPGVSVAAMAPAISDE